MISTSEFDDDDYVKGLYENGHWEWDDKTERLEFILDPNLAAQESWISPPAALIIGAADFKDDIDVIEQQRFRKLVQRKTFEGDIVRLQDIKDVVMYTAPSTFLTHSVVMIMHQPGTDRFLRALILYHQYYLQVADEMGQRMLELESKVRTPYSDEIESVYKENLEDLRLLIAKEYSNIVIGGGDFQRFHHMGPSKKMQSLSKKGNIVFESLIRLSIQVVWIALGRKSFRQIELEMHRLFKTQKFNMVEHIQKTNYVARLTPQERFVLFGGCIQNERLMKTRSPLKNEIDCPRNIDWRLLGLGIIKFPNLGRRLQYMQDALVAPENLLKRKCVTVGIVGFQRNRFDTLLKEIMIPVGDSSMNLGGRQSVARSRSMMASRISRLSRSLKASSSPRASMTSRKSVASAALVPEKFIPDIVFPPRSSEDEWIPHEFPNEFLPRNPCDPIQTKKWLARASRLAKKRARRMYRRHKLRDNK